MKTKEEIEQLKVEIYRDIQGGIGGDYGFFSAGFNIGHSECKEDMLDALEMHILINEHDWNRNPQAQLRDFIESLNKQD